MNLSSILKQGGKSVSGDCIQQDTVFMRLNLKNVPKGISQAQQALCGGESEGLGNPALAVLCGERGRDELGARGGCG